MSELTGRIGEQDTLAARQFANQQQMQQNQLMVQLAGLMAGGDPALLGQVMSRFGFSAQPTGTPAPAAAPAPAATPTPTVAPTVAPTIAPETFTGGMNTGLTPTMLAQMATMFNPYGGYGF